MGSTTHISSTLRFCIVTSKGENGKRRSLIQTAGAICYGFILGEFNMFLDKIEERFWRIL